MHQIERSERQISKKKILAASLPYWRETWVPFPYYTPQPPTIKPCPLSATNHGIAGLTDRVKVANSQLSPTLTLIKKLQISSHVLRKCNIMDKTATKDWKANREEGRVEGLGKHLSE